MAESLHIARSSNGRTADFESVNLGSIPSLATSMGTQREGDRDGLIIHMESKSAREKLLELEKEGDGK
jgi:hypothetical protein